ncbi:MAG TPA: condensation domain-containing protein, partial [Pyrinomonadaceae bacterium]|nr:condensation domain-containing protein [Pyrinomonadaceae bacterium]
MHKQLAISLLKNDWRGMPAAAQAEQLSDFNQAERDRRIDISKAPLMRLSLCQLAEDEYHFIWSYHPLILDDSSAQSVLKEVFAFYTAPGQAARATRSYRDYIAWLKQQNTAESETFWRKALQGFSSPTSLAVGRASGDWLTQELGYDHRELTLPLSTSGALESLAKEHGLSLHTITQGALALLLNRYSDEEDVVFGVRVEGRPLELPGAESIPGPFQHSLPLRVRVKPHAKVLDWLRRIQSRYAEVCRYQYNSLDQIKNWGDVPEGIPVFESAIALVQDLTTNEALAGSTIQLHDIESSQQSNLALTLQVQLNPKLTLKLTYDRTRFDEDTIARMLRHLQTLFAGIVAQPEQRLHAVPLLDEREHYQVLIEPNQTDIGYPQDQCIHWMFEQQAERAPEIDAVIFNNERLSYAALNERANQLAHHLQSLGVGPEVRVGLCVERSFDMLVGMIGILKAGGAYVPLDPSYPPDRLAFMLDDAQASVLLTQERLEPQLP